jgi:hypothetical protein
MTQATRIEQAAQMTTAASATTTPAPRQRRGRGRRRLGRTLRPVYPMRAYWEQVSEEVQRQAHLRAAIILEYWTGVKSKQEAAKALCVPPIRIWQMSQRAATGLVCALLTPPSGKRGPPMSASEDEKALRKENERLRRENQLQRELIEVLRELPGNRDRDLPATPLTSATPTDPSPAKEAEAKKPRRTKSRPEPRALPEGPGVGPAPPSPPR